MRIALTGGTGFIGSWILREFADTHEFLIVGRNDSIEQITVDGNSFKYLGTDYSVDSLVNHLDHVDAVVHLAAKMPVSKQSSETYEDFIPNIAIAASLFEACRLIGIGNIVSISSISVYGSRNAIPYSEDHKTCPDIFYGLSKVAIEDLAEYHNRKDGMAIKSLRLGQLVGLGEREGFMLMVFIKKAMNNETLTVFGAGEGRREYVYVKDVVSAIMAALKNKDICGIFNIGSGKNTSHRELAETINTVFENHENVAFLEDTPEDKSQHLMNIEKAKQELGWHPQWTLEQALYDMKSILKAE